MAVTVSVVDSWATRETGLNEVAARAVESSQAILRSRSRDRFRRSTAQASVMIHAEAHDTEGATGDGLWIGSTLEVAGLTEGGQTWKGSFRIETPPEGNAFEVVAHNLRTGLIDRFVLSVEQALLVDSMIEAGTKTATQHLDTGIAVAPPGQSL